MLSVDQFAESVKKKYPAYKEMDNLELTQKIIKKYPTYKNQVNLSGQSIESSFADTRSVAERKGYFGKRIDSLKRTAGRVKSAAVNTKDAFISAQEKVVDGVGEIKSTKAESEILQKRLNDLKIAFEAGEMDQGEYEEKRQKAQIRKDKVAGEGFAGVAKVARGGAETAFSPVTGAITGGLENELGEVAKKTSEGFQKLTPERQGQVMGTIEALKEFGDDHPGLRDATAVITEFMGLGAGKKLATNTGKVVNESLEQVAKNIPKAVEKTRELAVEGVELATEGITKLKNVRAEKQFGKNLAASQEIVRPLPTVKNLREAAESGQASLGKKGLFSGSEDIVGLSPKMEKSAKTLANHFPDLKDTSPIILPKKIKDKISAIALPVSEKFKKMPISKEMKDRVSTSWEKLKRTQAADENFSLGVDKMQAKFEENYLNQLTKKFKSVDGKFRQPNADDVWDIAKAYDNSVGSKIKNATEASDARFVVQQEAWMQNRRVLRDIMDDLAEAADDPSVKKAFEEMSDLYEAQSQILKNIKPTNKNGTSKARDFLDEYKKQLLIIVGGGAAAKTLLD